MRYAAKVRVKVGGRCCTITMAAFTTGKSEKIDSSIYGPPVDEPIMMIFIL
jgi:hypothetical protein